MTLTNKLKIKLYRDMDNVLNRHLGLICDKYHQICGRYVSYKLKNLRNVEPVRLEADIVKKLNSYDFNV